MISDNAIYFFFNFLFLITGASGIILALLLYRRNRSSLIKTYLFALSTWTLSQITLTAFYYLNEVVGYNDRFLNTILNDFDFVLMALFAYLLPSLVYQLFKRVRTARNRTLFLVLTVVIMIPCSYPGLRFESARSLFDRFELIKVMSMYGIFYYVAFFVFRNLKRAADKEVAGIIRLAFYLQLVFYPLMIIEGAFYFDRIYPFGISSFALFYFAANLLWLYYASNYLHLPELRVVDDSSSIDRFCDIFRISHREKQIVELVLEGLSYREIAERLFISLETVKTHINNIYKKANVKSKMELARLIRKCE
jgi:DNA-binding CsgD family transcriptional regulator